MKKILLLLFIAAILLACKKNFLEERPSTTIAEPNTLDLMIILLDHPYNTMFNAINTASSDDYYISDISGFESLPIVDRNAYIWKKDIYEGGVNDDWNLQYSGILNANVVLGALQKFPPSVSDLSDADYVKGWALFTRAWALNQLVQTFSQAYNPASAKTDLGVPIKLTPNVDEVNQRATLENTYGQIFSDLRRAIPLLPKAIQTQYFNRPTKAAAYALAARICLSMRDYENARNYADSCLNIHSTLVDFNNLSKTSTNPFANNTQEYLLYSDNSNWIINAYSTRYTFMCVDSTLYNQYNNDDLRKVIYFRLNSQGNPYQKRINPIGFSACGLLTTSEMYLIKAETEVRRNEVDIAKIYLNRLLEKRWATGKYQPIITSDPEVLLNSILNERRKELIFKGLRWSDLKRLNLEGRNITLRRLLNGQEYTLEPNSPRYVFPIPDEEISRSGIQQNIR
ncbi:RagB/SusD family nutrient uptake outer membrane protein [Pedobacter ginsengisoli]|uniref:RagB/SusD family nutrient uptake outer membrane protein n=1 Tax=Pedobacter ginsengisoli TaxID=363852 RepID=UPI0025504E00|nr:RagB/SusD family nutrient uptake outer membrane protein [Pedobacter ginsengisoli]